MKRDGRGLRSQRWLVQVLCLCAWLAVATRVGAMTSAQGATNAPPARARLGERIALYLRDHGCPPKLAVVAVATLPIVELRGAVPVGINLLREPWWWVFVLAVVGNMLPIPFILLLLGPLSRVCMKTRLGRRFFEWLFARTRRKTASIEKYETLGLTIFVAIPLPATGAWTGAIAAFLLGLRFHHAMWSIFLGVVIAGVIMTVLSLLGWLGAAVAGVALLVLAVGSLSRWLNREAQSSS
ncbi:MAG: small multi-drug export protein [bacterium]|nr:small multi-drug export protein [bacterium]